jgi:hypothetical protein
MRASTLEPPATPDASLQDRRTVSTTPSRMVRPSGAASSVRTDVTSVTQWRELSKEHTRNPRNTEAWIHIGFVGLMAHQCSRYPRRPLPRTPRD